MANDPLAAADDYFTRQKQIGSGQLNGVSAVKPDAAVQAIKDAPVSGIAPAVGMGDPEQGKGLADLHRQTTSVNSTPSLQSWFSGDPAKVAATQDDVGGLLGVSNSVAKFLQNRFTDFTTPFHEMADTYRTMTDPNASASDRLHAADRWGTLYVLQKSLAEPLTNLVAGPASRALVPADTEANKGIQENLRSGLNFAGMFGLPFLGKAFEGVKPAERPAVIDEGLIKRMQPLIEGKPEEIIDAEFHDITPPRPGAYESMDQTYLALADHSAEMVKQAEEAVVASKTQTRLPALTADFVNQNFDATVHVDANALLEIAQEQKMVPGDLEEAFQHVPGFLDNYLNALTSGGSIPMKLGDYLAAASGKPWADQLRESTQFNPNGVSQLEGKELGAPLEDFPLKPIERPEDISPEEHQGAVALVETATRAIQEAAKSRYLKLLFENEQAAGMTKDQFARYSQKIENAAQAGYERLLNRAYAQIRKERGPQWLERLGQNRAVVEQEFFGRRDMQAAFYLRYGQHPSGAPLESSIKLDRSSVSGELADRLPGGYFGKDGLSADEAGEIFGYGSGEEMLQDLAKMEDAIKAAKLTGPRDYMQRLIKAQAHRMTGDKLGFDLTPENIAEAAAEAVNAPEAESILIDELKALSKQSGEPFEKTDIQGLARDTFGKLKVQDALRLKDFERALGRLGRQTEIALLKGDPIKAFRFKQQQLIQHYMLEMSHELNRDFAKMDKRFRGWARKAQVPSVAQEWMNFAHLALRDIGYPLKRDVAELFDQVGNETLEDFVQRKGLEGYVIAGGRFVAEGVRDLPVEQYENARDLISSLVHNGRVVQGVVINGKRVSFNDIIARVKANADALGRKLTPERLEKLSVSGTAGRVSRSLNAPMIRPEQLMDEMDQNDPLGPLNQAVIYPLQEGKGWENDELHRITKDLKDFAKTQPKEWIGSLDRKVPSNNLQWTNPRTGMVEARIVTRGQMIRLMLNLGNKGNASKLLEGYQWDRGDVDQFLAANATKADWDFVQHIWDMHESLWPKIASTYRNLAGVAPKRVIANPVSTPFGQYRGGYFPISYDKLRAPEVRTMSSDSIWGEDYQSSLPPNGYTKGRTGYVAPINLNWTGLNTAIGQIIHDLAFREPLSQANRVLSNNDVRTAIQDNFGPEYTAQLRPWMEYTARERVFDDRAAEGLTNLMKNLRTNITFVGLAYRASSVMIHADVAISDSIGEVGAARFSSAMLRLWQTPAQHKYWVDYVTTNSPEIRNRLVNMDSNIREAVNELAKKQGFLSDIQKYGFHALAISDNLSAIPTWMAAVEDEVAKGRSPEEAFQIADKRVRQAHGSSAPVDLPAMQRSSGTFFGELGKTVGGMFLSFMNHNYNRIWGIGRAFGKAGDEAKAGDWAGATRDFSDALSRSLWYIIVPALTVTALKTYQKKGTVVPHSFGDWIDGVAHATFGGYPGVGPLLASLERRDPGANPLDQVMISQASTINNAWKMAHGDNEHVSKRWLQQALATAGYWTGKVPGQAGTTGQYIWDFATGNAHPADFNQFLRGVLFGPEAKGEKKEPGFSGGKF